MEVDQPENNSSKGVKIECETLGPKIDREPVRSLYEMIDDPGSCLVNDQVDDNTVKMVLICLNGEQKLISFHRPSVDCTVQDLLDEANIPSCGGFITFLVKDAEMGSSYVVTHISKIDSFQETVNLSDIETNEKQNELLSSEWEGSELDEMTRINENQSEVDPRLFQVSAAKGILYQKGNMEYEYSPIQGPHTLLISRIVMIGSYSYILQGKVLIMQSCVRLRVPHLRDAMNLVLLELKFDDILKVLIHFGEVTPVLFFWIAANASARIRQCLGMHDPDGPYYKPDSRDNKQRRITLLVDEITEESKLMLKTLFTPKNLLSELSSKEATDLLLSISANNIRPEITNLIKNSKKTTSTVHSITHEVVNKLDRVVLEKSNSVFEDTMNDKAEGLGKQDQSSTKVSEEMRATIDNTEHKKKKLVSKASESIENTENRKNDVVLRASKNCLKKTRAATSTSTSSNSTNEGVQILLVYPPPPARGGISITAKDLACLEENKFLNDVIIDFYLKYLHLQVLSAEDRNRTHIFSIHFYTRLTSPLSPSTDSDEPILQAAKRHANVRNWTKSVNIFEKDFIIVPINEYSHWFLAIVCFPGLVGKAETNSMPGGTTDVRKPRKAKELKLQAAAIQDKKGIRKFPCILIFDSLGALPRKAQSVLDILRSYLRCEHLAKFETEIIFSEETIKGSCPKVPQQDNCSDCGLYVLQYVESFFSNPITDYTLPIKTLKNWFHNIVVARKRRRLSKLLGKLIDS